jgi:hypothetical protein
MEEIWKKGLIVRRLRRSHDRKNQFAKEGHSAGIPPSVKE